MDSENSFFVVHRTKLLIAIGVLFLVAGISKYIREHSGRTQASALIVSGPDYCHDEPNSFFNYKCDYRIHFRDSLGNVREQTFRANSHAYTKGQTVDLSYVPDQNAPVVIGGLSPFAHVAHLCILIGSIMILVALNSIHSLSRSKK